ncbi:reverse transcriptase [Penicillium italicum]|uniref:Reverse transcriptase n=1 Tax=Penicillium italicum TaxID=40296 RepID=A0A0A2L1E1_PENIT|nr:reverse transcriptase [Penicillium italicum]
MREHLQLTVRGTDRAIVDPLRRRQDVLVKQLNRSTNDVARELESAEPSTRLLDRVVSAARVLPSDDVLIQVDDICCDMRLVQIKNQAAPSELSPRLMYPSGRTSQFIPLSCNNIKDYEDLIKAAPAGSSDTCVTCRSSRQLKAGNVRRISTAAEIVYMDRLMTKRKIDETRPESAKLLIEFADPYATNQAILRGLAIYGRNHDYQFFDGSHRLQQYYRYQIYGHIARNCKRDIHCAYYAGDHNSKECPHAHNRRKAKDALSEGKSCTPSSSTEYHPTPSETAQANARIAKVRAATTAKKQLLSRSRSQMKKRRVVESGEESQGEIEEDLRAQSRFGAQPVDSMNDVVSRNKVMMHLFGEEGLLDVEILAIQEPEVYSHTNPMTTYSQALGGRFHVLLRPTEQADGGKVVIDAAKPRVCFYVNKRIDPKSWSIRHHTQDASTLTVKSNRGAIRVHNVYVESKVRDEGDENRQEIRAATAKATLQVVRRVLRNSGAGQHVVVGDFNLHHPLWSQTTQSQQEDEDDDDLTSIMDDRDMQLLTQRGAVTYEGLVYGNRVESTLDLTWASRSLAEQCTRCTTQRQWLYAAGHVPVLTEFDIQCIEAPSRTITNWREADWDEWLKVLRSKTWSYHPLRSTVEVNQTVEELISAMADATHGTVPTKTVGPHSFPAYTKKLEDLRRQVNRARRWARETGSDGDQELFRHLRHNLGRQSVKVANESHRERVGAATKSIDDFWKLVRNTTPRATYTPTLRVGDTEYVTAEEKADILREVLFPHAPTADLSDLEGYDYPTAVSTPLITSEEVMHAVQRSASYKASGPDGIPNAALKKAIEIPSLLRFLTHLFNECLQLGYCPNHFRESTTVILRKPGKLDYTMPKAYRPITLLSTLGKALESVLATRLSYLVEAHALLPDIHIGGRVGRPCDHALHLILERVYESWKQDEHVATLLTLDVTGAFDHVAHERLAHCLRKRRIPEEMVRWILSFLRDRSTTLVLQEGSTGTHPVAIGIPQGSPLSPILYLFYNADLIDELHAAAAGKALVTGYIDDICILSPCPALRTAKYGLMHMWKKGWSIRRANRPPSGESITLQGVEVRPTSSLKYLGVMLNEHLTGESQIAQCRKKAAQLIAALRSIAGMTWGVSTLHLRRMWTAVLLPQISFACSAWYTQGAYGSKTFEDRANRAFRSMQRQVLQYIAGAFRTTAGPALEVCLFVPPAPIAIQRLAEEACLRIHVSPLRCTLAARSNEGRRYGLMSPLKRLETLLKFKGIEVNRLELIRPFAVPPWWQPPETRIAPDKQTAIKEHGLILRATPLYGPNSAIAYTDGSKTESGGIGVSTVTSKGNATARLDDQDTVYAAELKGILLALCQIKDDLVRELVATSRAPARTMTIFTDNQAAIQVCAQPRRSSGQQIIRNITPRIEDLRLAA